MTTMHPGADKPEYDHHHDLVDKTIAQLELLESKPKPDSDGDSNGDGDNKLPSD